MYLFFFKYQHIREINFLRFFKHTFPHTLKKYTITLSQNSLDITIFCFIPTTIVTMVTTVQRYPDFVGTCKDSIIPYGNPKLGTYIINI